MSRVHTQSATRYLHNEKQDVLYPAERHRHLAYDLGSGPCPVCGKSVCFPGDMLTVHQDRFEAALSS